jgi:hypothetical protein
LHCFKFCFYSLVVEMLFFSLLCLQGVNSTNFAGWGNPRSIISLGGREFHLTTCTTLVNLVHSVCYRFFCATSYLAPRLRRGDALRLVACEAYVPWNLPAWKRWRSSRHCALSNDCVTLTQGRLNCINDTKCLENWARFRRFARKLFRNCKWFSNFSVLCECCWWKFLVRCKTLIYCGKLCNNAVNYPSTPLTDLFLFVALIFVLFWFAGVHQSKVV